jgi:hypothetical protein
MGANMAGIYGAQLYRDDDEPRYRRAFSICIAVLSLGCTIAIIRKIDEWRLRRKGIIPGADEQVDETEAYEDLQKRRPSIGSAPPNDVKPSTDIAQGALRV